MWTARKVKTDAADAAMIADLVRYKRYEPSALGDKAAGELRSLARYRMSLVGRSTELKNRATAILDRVFPELDGLFGGSSGPTQRKLLEHCATPGQVLSTDVRAPERILREASGGKCGRGKAEEPKEAAERSVGVGFSARTLAFEVRLLMEEPGFVRGQIGEVESELARLLDETSGRWLLAVPVVGLALALAITGEIGGANRFDGPTDSWPSRGWIRRRVGPARRRPLAAACPSAGRRPCAGPSWRRRAASAGSTPASAITTPRRKAATGSTTAWRSRGSPGSSWGCALRS